MKNWAEVRRPATVYVTYDRNKAAILGADEVDKVENEAQRVFPEEGLKRIRIPDRDLFVLENIAGNGWIARH